MEKKENIKAQTSIAEDNKVNVVEEAEQAEKAGKFEKSKEVKQEQEQEQEKVAEEKKGEEQKEEQKQDFKSKYFYLAAELENQRKRFQKERENLFKFGAEKILSDLIEVVDNLERTVAAIEKSDDEKVKNIVKGVNMVKKQFLDTLERHGLSPLESLGKEFDPNVHEAMAQEESDQQSNNVIRVFEQGYKLNGRLLRAAKVIVAK